MSVDLIRNALKIPSNPMCVKKCRVCQTLKEMRDDLHQQLFTWNKLSLEIAELFSIIPLDPDHHEGMRQLKLLNEELNDITSSQEKSLEVCVLLLRTIASSHRRGVEDFYEDDEEELPDEYDG